MPAEPEVIWAWICRPDLWPTYYSNAKFIKHLGGPGRSSSSGSRFRWLSFGAFVTSEVVEYEPAQRIAWDAKVLGGRGYHGWVLRRQDGGHIRPHRGDPEGLRHPGRQAGAAADDGPPAPALARGPLQGRRRGARPRPRLVFQCMGAIEELRERLGEIHDLGRAASLLAWDERTMMPKGGAEARAETLATLARVRHEMFIDDEIGAPDRPGALRARRRTLPPGESIDADLIRVVARDWEKARRVPSELRAELARASSIAENAWVEAKARSDFPMLLPHLERERRAHPPLRRLLRRLPRLQPGPTTRCSTSTSPR